MNRLELSLVKDFEELQVLTPDGRNCDFEILSVVTEDNGSYSINVRNISVSNEKNNQL